VNVGGQTIGFEQGADTNEVHGVPGPSIVAPQGNATLRTSADLLPFATVRGSQHDLGRTGQHNDILGLDQCVEREG